MMDIFLLLLNQQRSDILLAIKLRKAGRIEKYVMISNSCACCINRMIRNTYMLSDEQLVSEKAKIDETIADITSEINITQLL